jgi:hypothetical protein
MGDPALDLLINPSDWTPPPVEDLAVVATEGNICLSWSAVEGPVASYIIYRSASASGSFAAIASVPAGQTSYSDICRSGEATASFYYVTAVSFSSP